ncbi:MAG: transglutaminase-like domain-containing protein [Candidatus Rokubacteria bacterium]|nr:transglutaminase-like domain-containing protein [Candidatus Rokubacteria bacterium]
MTGLLSRRVPSWAVALAALALAAIVAAATLALRSAREGPGGPAEEARSSSSSPRKPMTVFRFVDPAEVRHRTRFMFSFDPPPALAELRSAERLDSVVAGAASDIDRFRRLTAWARAQFEPGIPDPYPPLDARIILRDIRSGFTGGFCAQYNYVLAQSLMSLGYPARYVTVEHHEVIEGWLRDERRWVCLDPLHSATYVDEEGRALSVLEIVSRARAGRPPLPGPGSLPSAATEAARAFTRFEVWIRNDHVSRPINFTDIDRYKVSFRWEGEARGDGALATSLPEDLYFDPESP